MDKIHCCVSTAIVVTRTRHIVTLYVHLSALCYMILTHCHHNID